FETPIAGDVSYLDTTTIVSNYTTQIANNGNTPESRVNHDFNTHANIDIQLVVESSYSCYDTILFENYFDVIIPLPNFTVEPNWIVPPCDSMEFDIIDQSNFVEEFTFVWLGDGVYTDTYDIGYTNTVTFEFPYVEEMSDESYLNYRFFIYDAIYKGCTNNFDTLVTILATPEVNMSISELEVCENEIIDLFDTSIYSSNADTSVSQFYWNFGDGTTSINQNDSHAYSEAGTYNISHHVTNGICSGDTTKTTITVKDNPEADYSFSDSPICYGSEIEFENNSQSSLITPSIEALWSFEIPGEPITLHFTDTTVSFVPQTNPFEQENLLVNVNLTITHQNGCSDSISNTDEFIILDSLVNTPEINFVSVTDSGVYISIEETYDDYFNLFEVHQINSIFTTENVGTTESNEFIHYTSIPNDQINEYILIQEDLCNYESDSSDIHSTILLSTSSNDYQKIDLEWSAYSAWDSVASYEIFRSVDGEDFQYIDYVPGTQLSYLDSNMCNVPHGYYVRANHTKGEFSSNSNKSYIQPMYVNFMQPIYLTSSVVNNNAIKTIINSDFIGYGYYYQVDRWDDYFGWSEEYGISYGSSFTDENVGVSSRNYIYQVTYHDDCGNEGVISNIGSNILLEGETLPNHYLLTWNPYREWNGGVEEYHVQLLNQESNEFETIEVLEPLSTEDSMNYTDKDLLTSGIDTSYCYRIEAHRRNSFDKSYSNTKCFTAEL
ncbi:MAG: PKD domain-containing protein, partial [Gammaproteobacteria bacterium]|nr:PKD domain-containing protein [Gammaproteobacteria bacterium]